MSDLASVIVGNPDDVARIPQLRQGVVTAINPLFVRVGSATTAMACRCLNGVGAAVGDTVSVLIISGDRLVLGKASQSSMAPLNVGIPSYYGDPYRGLNWGEHYLIMSEGGTTFISTPHADGNIHIRPGINEGTYSLVIANNGNHTIGGSFDQLTSRGVGYFGNTLHMVGNHVGPYWPDWGGGWQMTDTTYMRCYGNKVVYSAGGFLGGNFTGGEMFASAYKFAGTADTDTYIAHGGDGQINFVTNAAIGFYIYGGIASTNAQPLRLHTATNGNHAIQYSAGIDGVEVVGTSKIRLYTVTGGHSFDHGSDGWGRATNGWTTHSSLKLKENIADLPIERAVEMVRGLRPVTFDMKNGTRTDDIGFIAEWTDPVVPQAVAAEMDEETPASIDYSRFTPILTRVLQDVLDRLDALEATT